MASERIEPMLNRMGIALLALMGVLISAYMSAYKLGMVGSLVCGTGGCETVQNSPWAVVLGIPVPYIGLAGYGALFVLAMAALQPRFQENRTIAALLLAAAVIGAVFSGYLTYLEAVVISAWCRWCIVSAVIAALILLLSLPELRYMRRTGPDVPAEA